MILSCISMIIDHVGCVFFPDSLLWRMIGRLAMPIYGYFIAAGYMHTSDIGRYIKRIVLIAIISQLPFMLLFNIRKLNMCFAWLLSLLIIYGIDKRNYRVLAFAVIITALTLLTISIDYSYYGICIPILFYIRNKSNAFFKDILLFFGIIILALPFRNAVQCLAVLAFPIIVVAEKYNVTRITDTAVKRCYQWFYPAHMVALLIISGAVKMVTAIAYEK